MITLFVVGASLGLILLIIEASSKQVSLFSLEGLLFILLYPALIGWMVCFTWKVIQWPFS